MCISTDKNVCYVYINIGTSLKCESCMAVVEILNMLHFWDEVNAIPIL